MISKYEQTGVDSGKRGIEVFKATVDDLFPGAFCVITRDPTNKKYGMIDHTDSAGSKPTQSYLHFKETGDISVYSDIVWDMFEMNVGDVFCVNAKLRSLADYVGLNPFNINKEEFLPEFNKGIKEYISFLRMCGIPVYFAGGETADLPDNERTFSAVGFASARIKLSEAITGYDIKPGNIIIGLGSGGQTTYERKRNSGLMCNFITLARHCLMLPEYAEKYPAIKGPEGKEYYGKFRTDQYHSDLGMTVGEAIISRTRSFAPFFAELQKNIKLKGKIKGFVFNTGGGQTKCLRLGRNIHYIKDNMPEPYPIFYLIQKESRETWKNMYKGGNMDIGLDIIGDESIEKDVTVLCKELGIPSQRTGYCEESKDKTRRENGNILTIESKFGTFEYPEPEKKE